MGNKKWSIHFVAGNPEIMSKVRTIPESPMLRSKALEAAKIIADNKWRVWVSNEDGERIFESDTEKQYTANVKQ